MMSDKQMGRSRLGGMARGHVLLVGGAGYVGSHAAKALARSGYMPVVYDNLSSGSLSVSKFSAFERGDMRDAERLKQVIDAVKPLAVLHCATSKNFAADPADPLALYDNLVRGTLTLLDVMRRTSVSYLCMLTSAEIYGATSSLNIAEQTPTEPLSAYGACLSAIENMVGDFGLAHDLNWVSLRLFGVGGADLESELGEDHKNETSLIPIAIDAALGKRDYVPIRGSHFATRDGTALRDYVHVTDVANAIVLALEHLVQKKAFGPYNIGSGRESSVLEIIRKIEIVSKVRCPVRYEAKVKEAPAFLSADTSRAHNELGWVPNINDIDELISSAFLFRKALWERRDREAAGPDQDADSALFATHESLTEIAPPSSEHEALLKTLDDFLNR